mgnify:CR=1 FL=1
MVKIPQNKYLYLFLLSLIWGSSYILIKRGLVGLSPIELGSVRIVLSTCFLVIMGYRSLKGLSKYQWKWLIITGFLGTFFPSFFFAFAQQHIDSSVAAILNSLTPIFTLLVGVVLLRLLLMLYFRFFLEILTMTMNKTRHVMQLCAKFGCTFYVKISVMTAAFPTTSSISLSNGSNNAKIIISPVNTI